MSSKHSLLEDAAASEVEERDENGHAPAVNMIALDSRTARPRESEAIQSQIREAYERMDATQSRRLHDAARGLMAKHVASDTEPAPSSADHQEEHGGKTSEYLKSIIYGGLDGIITTFSVVAASSGAQLGSDIILLMGFANLVGDGISMGMGDYLSSKADHDMAVLERNRERWELDHYPEGEKAEMVELYTNKGMSLEDATKVIDVFSKPEYKKMFVDLMLMEELQIMPPDDHPNSFNNGLATFLAFMGFGSLPLWFYVFFHIFGYEEKTNMFVVSAVVTMAALFFLGIFKANFTKQPRLKSGFQILANGFLAAMSAFLIGWAMESALGTESVGCE